ncbi:MAG: carboxypeptidase regulatory-like domain-containing protein [Phycisphaerae bacterium]|nr:carboxypeptidase regulatory-like domain-containing protein [Phycisphaerae bacterium]
MIGCDKLTFEGQETTWEALPGLVQSVPDRTSTVLELAFSPELAVSNSDRARTLRQEAQTQAAALVQEQELAGLNEIGTRKLGSRGTLCRAGPFELDADILLDLVVGPEQQPDAVTIQSIRFGTHDDQLECQINGTLRAKSPECYRVRIELTDAQGQRVGHTQRVLQADSAGNTAPAEGVLPIGHSFCAIGSKALLASQPTQFTFSIEPVPVAPQPPAKCDLRGTVVDATPNYSAEYFALLEQAAASGKLEEFRPTLERIFQPRPVPNALVTLQSAALTRAAVSDTNGQFEFTGLPFGEYQLSATAPTGPPATGEPRMATGKTGITLWAGNCEARLDLYADRITVRGRVVDADGQSVAGAKVTGIQEITESPSDEVVPHVVSATSGADGMYELSGLNPPNVWRTAGYLCGGDPTLDGHSFYTVVRVDAAGFIQGRGSIPRFPTVTEEVLAASRRLLTIMRQYETAEKGSSEVQERDDRGPFPASRGNTITGIDIVLERRPASGQISGRLVDTHGRPRPARMLDFSRLNDELASAPGAEYAAKTKPDGVATDANGAFELPDVYPGEYAIIVYGAPPNGWHMFQVPVAGRVVDVKPGARVAGFEIRINPAEEFAISGRVRDARGNPVPRLFVATSICTGFPWYAETNNAGEFRIEGLDGTGLTSFKVNFGHEGLALLNVPLNTRDLNLVMPDKGSIPGMVRDARTGAAVTDFEVEVPSVRLPDSGAVWERPQVQVERGADGNFTISNVPAGEATVIVRAARFGAQRFTLPVAASRDNPLECKLVGPAVLTGRTTLDGAPRGVAIVIADKWLGSDENGAFRFDQFPNGDYTVWFPGGDYTEGYGCNYRSAAVQLRSGETTRLDMEVGGTCEVRGTVKFTGDEPDCVVRIASKPGPDRWPDMGRPGPGDFVLAYCGVRQSGGEYRLRALPPGRYTLTVGRHRPELHVYVSALSRVVELKDGETLQLDLDVPPTK